ncbi:MAG: MOSC domain-containing protein [Actinobacteria bacterium]|jgi:MOSC domain-containing protein YiiM|nr:MOSC domain-containing protein [Actinomycetota bacterium]NDA95073.1 MOSC domain-containing protein [Actinomycetota bacterium]NDH80718.1 MOSC domain-containing protein [Actinomycetota bacterium]NDH99083.1 MOSC domain-containing protein [Actinomycetota bacterium]NDI07422.1 MOSC domain-containing protein [Actinomycetota bacterium]
MSARVLSINITSVVHQGEWTGSEGRTGIDKRSVSGPIEFKNNGVAGDRIIDTNVHGGYDQAVYAYAIEDAQWWENEISEEISAGRFGENLTTEGIDVNAALVGEQWKIGSVILEVSQPRIPCRVFAGFWKRSTLIKDFTKAGRPGTYLRIIQEGSAQAGDSIEVIFKPDHAISIKDLFLAKSGERSKINEIKEVEQLSSGFKEWAEKIAATQN